MYMKKFTLNLGVIIISFAIGLAINSACADSLGDSMSNVDNNIDKMDLSELKELVSALQGKVTTLENNLNKANNSISNLTTEVSSLQTKNDALTKRIASLEQNVSSDSDGSKDNSSVCEMFQVDGLWFNQAGFVENKMTSTTTCNRIIFNSGEVQESSNPRAVYQYDTFGRLAKISYDGYSQEYSYKGNVVTQTVEQITDSYRSIYTHEVTYDINSVK